MFERRPAIHISYQLSCDLLSTVTDETSKLNDISRFLGATPPSMVDATVGKQTRTDNARIVHTTTLARNWPFSDKAKKRRSEGCQRAACGVDECSFERDEKRERERQLLTWQTWLREGYFSCRSSKKCRHAARRKIKVRGIQKKNSSSTLSVVTPSQRLLCLCSSQIHSHGKV